MPSKPIPKKCCACAGLTTPLSAEDVQGFNQGVGWIIADDGKAISRTFVCKDYDDAVAFILAVAGIAAQENHHPDHGLTKYRRLTFSLTTHAAKGITVNDFVMARLINEAWDARKV